MGWVTFDQNIVTFEQGEFDDSSSVLDLAKCYILLEGSSIRDENNNYSINYIFTDSYDSDDFRLYVDSIETNPYIIYNLYFDNTQITKGTQYTWDNIYGGSSYSNNNMKQLTISNFNLDNALASGTYKDTITISISVIE